MQPRKLPVLDVDSSKRLGRRTAGRHGVEPRAPEQKDLPDPPDGLQYPPLLNMHTTTNIINNLLAASRPPVFSKQPTPVQQQLELTNTTLRENAPTPAPPRVPMSGRSTPPGPGVTARPIFSPVRPGRGPPYPPTLTNHTMLPLVGATAPSAGHVPPHSIPSVASSKGTPQVSPATSPAASERGPGLFACTQPVPSPSPASSLSVSTANPWDEALSLASRLASVQ
eukprot:Sspe_Gene.60383::Locus_33277_Transcript_1_1_Confidence_1.000_Length_1680::g.60383::m.60383